MASSARFFFRRQKKRLLAIRDKIRKNPAYGYAIAGVILVVAGVVAYVGLQEEVHGPDMSLIHYYDLNTGAYYTVKWDGYGSEHYHSIVPPQPAPSGPLEQDNGPLSKGDPAGLRVYKYACEDCSNEQFVGYHETYTVKVKENIIAGIATPEEIIFRHFWQTPGSDKWVIKDSAEGQAILNELVKRCPGKRLAECNPRD